jgi:hypothetical protein
MAQPLQKEGLWRNNAMHPHVASMIVMLLVAATPTSADPAPACVDPPPELLPSTPYSAIRRLEAENKKTGKQAWMEVRTVLDADGVLTVSVLSEGGSEQIRSKVLRPALQAEQDALTKRRVARTPADGYECGEPQLERSGLLRLPLRPKEKSRHLVVGDMFIQPATRDLVSVKGQLAKSPSFWVSRVDVEWTYRRVYKSQVLPVTFQSTANVKMFGPSTFRMTYDYESVNGEPILRRTRAASH